MSIRTIIIKLWRRFIALIYLVYKPSVITIDGFKVSIDKRVISPKVRWSLYNKCYEIREVEILKKTIDKNDVVIELGGGIGFIGIVACRYLNNHSNMNIYEANPYIIDLMKMNFELNNVKPIYNNCVLGDSDGKSDFYIHKDFWGSSLIPMNDYKEKISIEKRSFIKVLEEIKPSFLIIDIEGGEVDLFNMVSAEDIQSVKKICIEIHPSVLTSGDLTNLVKKFLEWGFLIDFKLGHNGVLYFYR